MPSTLELSRYHVALRFLQEGRRDWTLVLVGELLHSHSGRPLGLRLLTQMYPEGSRGRTLAEGLVKPEPGFAAVLVAGGQET